MHADATFTGFEAHEIARDVNGDPLETPTAGYTWLPVEASTAPKQANADQRTDSILFVPLMF